MAELAAADLAAFTGNRLLAADASTATVLTAALAAARRYCGWTVSPVVEVTATLDGPGGYVLALPTRNLISITALSENGTALDVTKLDASKRTGIVTKFPRSCWTSRAGGISVTMNHGYTEAEAADWRRSVLRLADLLSLQTSSSGLRDDPSMVRKRIDDVEYQWAERIITTDDLLPVMFAQFRILQSP